MSSLHTEFPTLDNYVKDRESLDSNRDTSRMMWTEHFTGSITQMLFKWINPSFMDQSMRFVYELDKICREDLPVIHLASLFQSSVS